MICDQIQDILGMACYPLNDDGSIALIASPFTFEDGDGLPIYVEKVGGKVRFFDDGGVLLHFKSRGLSLDNGKRTRFIKNIAAENGAIVNDDGELEVWSTSDAAAHGFAKYMSALMGLVGWERSQRGINGDAALLVEEVAICLQAWKPGANITRAPEYLGISGHAYALDFSIDGEAIIAIKPHPNSVSAALKKMVDIISAPSNQGLTMSVVIDDRQQPSEARSEGAVLNAVADVLMMSKLEQLAKSTTSIN